MDLHNLPREKLEKIKKYLEEANDKENPKNFRSELDGYYQEIK